MTAGRPRGVEPTEEQKKKIVKMYLSGTTILNIAADLYIPKAKVSQAIKEAGIQTNNGAIARSKLYGKDYDPEMIEYVPGEPAMPIEQFKAKWAAVTRRFQKAYARSQHMTIDEYDLMWGR